MKGGEKMTELELGKLTNRPAEVVTWETRIEPQVMASLAQWFSQQGVQVGSKSQLLRLSCFTLMDLLKRLSGLVEIQDLATALEVLHQQGLINKNSPASISSKRATAVERALAMADGMGFDLPAKFVKQPRSEVSYGQTYEDRVQQKMDEIKRLQDAGLID